MNKLIRIDDYYKTDNTVNWDKLIDDFNPYVTKIINNMSNDNLSKEDKEEITLDVFFVLWKNKNNIFASLDSYIAGITRNLVREKFRKKQITYDISDYENQLTDSTFNMYLEETKEIYRIEKEFSNLNEIDRKIVNMFYYSAMSLKEISKELNISEFNVSTRLYRIRKKIKNKLKNGGKNG